MNCASPGNRQEPEWGRRRRREGELRRGMTRRPDLYLTSRFIRTVMKTRRAPGRNRRRQGDTDEWLKGTVGVPGGGSHAVVPEKVNLTRAQPIDLPPCRPR
ncbi:hypothetical protein EYF80_001719 [Liparis tanakae]|uniref:Uncharacterized protein n=1 Tax=Liparis tanakae TaxID=230148 RepID=A0A4Z2JET5_9TELE|nr:hypothetical protein EYF80_001719 [Liparis tanakae]